MIKGDAVKPTDINGIIIKGVGGAYTVLADGITYVCNARGVFRNRNITPLVGDKVLMNVTDKIDDDDEKKRIGTLHTIEPRKNQLLRPPIANVDQVIITVSASSPAFNPGLLDRFLVLVAYENIPAVICINKCDDATSLSKNPEFQPYINAGYPIIFASAMESTGLDSLRDIMAGKLNVFAGASGVGKSSLINSLSPKLELETGGLSHKLGRGKHTTRHTEIFPLDSGGYCADTPGFTSLEISAIPKNELASLFKEFLPFINECRFSNCLHDRESYCAIKEQVGKAIFATRYESYVNLINKDTRK